MFNSLKRMFKGGSKEGFVLNKSADASFTRGDNIKIVNTNITLEGKSSLVIHNNVKLDGYDINIKNGTLEIGEHSQLIKGRQVLNPVIAIDNGTLSIGDYNVVKADIKLRFGGICSIGTYNCVNEGSEIRCDQSIVIGDFNMISYECMIYDTNTHCIYTPEVRRERSKADFPFLGTETEKPNTMPVVIGNDNWLGKRCVVLKGSILGNQVTVGTNAVVSNLHVGKGLVIGNPAYIVDKK